MSTHTCAGIAPSGVEERGSTMEFGKRIGWARMGLVVSAVLLAVMGVICFVGHGILPEALHTPNLPEGYTWPAGELIGAVVMAVVGIVQIAAWKNAGGSKTISGYLVISGIMALACAVAAVLDPFCGTFSFEWVIAVFIAFVGLGTLFGAFCTKHLKYKGLAIEIILSLVLVALALGVVLDSSNSSIMAGIAFFVYAVLLLMPVAMGNSIQIED